MEMIELLLKSWVGFPDMLKLLRTCNELEIITVSDKCYLI